MFVFNSVNQMFLNKTYYLNTSNNLNKKLFSSVSSPNILFIWHLLCILFIWHTILHFVHVLPSLEKILCPTNSKLKKQRTKPFSMINLIYCLFQVLFITSTQRMMWTIDTKCCDLATLLFTFPCCDTIRKEYPLRHSQN